MRQMDTKFWRERFTLTEVMELFHLHFESEPFIRFDPRLDYQYRIIRTQAHDGTLIFTRELIAKAMLPLFHRASYFKPMGEPLADQERIYTIGNVRLARVYGMVDVPAGRIQGVRESIVIPVRCEYVKRKTQEGIQQ